MRTLFLDDLRLPNNFIKFNTEIILEKKVQAGVKNVYYM
jgi:hypothetical protein